MDTTRERYPSSLREYLAKNRSGPLQRDEAVSFGEDVESGI
jgi:hypothetical protein